MVCALWRTQILSLINRQDFGLKTFRLLGFWGWGFWLGLSGRWRHVRRCGWCMGCTRLISSFFQYTFSYWVRFFSHVETSFEKK